MPNPWCTSELFKSWVKWPDAWDIDCEESYDEAAEKRGRKKNKNWNRQSKRRAKRAHRAVSRAIKRNRLADLKKHFIKCVDCGARATQYEHRDYTKPLEVDPVCRSCNSKRGPTKFEKYEPPQNPIKTPKFKFQAAEIPKIDLRVSEALLLINRKWSKNLASRIEYELRKKNRRGKYIREQE